MNFGLKNTSIDQIIKVFTKYPELEKVLIYGSRAKGNFKPGSDIDLTFIGDGLNQSILNKIEDDIDDLFLPYTFDLSILKHISNDDFIAHVSRVGIVFYERGINAVSVK
jgi:predicted nucleotidyltransferase